MKSGHIISRYYGGKNKEGMGYKVICPLLPNTPFYAEPFCGMASVFLNKRPVSSLNILNDIDGRIVNLLRMVRERGDELADLLAITPSSREEFVAALEQDDADPLKRAWQTLVVLWQGIPGTVKAEPTAFRTLSLRAGRSRGGSDYSRAIRAAAKVFCQANVSVERRDANDLISWILERHNGPEALLYCDPPYLHSTRVNKAVYGAEMSLEQHKKFLALVKDCKANVCISGYASDLYDTELADWKRVEKDVPCKGAAVATGTLSPRRKEILWINYGPPGRIL